MTVSDHRKYLANTREACINQKTTKRGTPCQSLIVFPSSILKLSSGAEISMPIPNSCLTYIARPESLLKS